MTYFLLSSAIVVEVIATLLLKASNGWEKWEFGVVSILLYSVAGFLFAIVLKTMNVGIAYTIWSGFGVALVCLFSIFFWQQKLDIYALIGIILILAGTMLITLKSNVIIQ